MGMAHVPVEREEPRVGCALPPGWCVGCNRQAEERTSGWFCDRCGTRFWYDADIDWPADDPPAAIVVQKLLTCLWLYGGYETRSRGDYGCVLAAIDAVAPEVAQRLRDGESPGMLLNEIDPEQGHDPNEE